MTTEGTAAERLIEAAIRLLWMHGYSSVSVDQLCEAAGTKKGSFYHFFASKEDLALAALEAHWSRRRPLLDVLFSPSLGPLERLDRYFRFIFQRQCEIRAEHGRVLGCFYFSLGSATVDQPRLNAAVRQIISVYERYYKSALVEASQLGLLRVADPAAKARDLFRYTEGLLADARLHDSVEGLRDLPQFAWEFLGVTGVPLPEARAGATTT